MDKELVYKGVIRNDELRENHSTIYIGDIAILPEIEKIGYNKNVTVEYCIESDYTLSGILESEYYPFYTDWGGYMWTNQELRIGKYDLLKELYNNVGKYIELKIIVH